ncbi:hypothetical protein C1T31_00560 [Hanstruepera neustonica]|uniref:tRNA_anti-like n=1 Tax=Hanstruepera neustonica TaxID=1445657 RepID=A0A2K1E350_9FLAO|nr:hypothetical protein [Hanstruepera neustonica]PNQ74671.1 hypothetical protein C1T31_00560 [Hanstruepera neustonica]
MRKWSIFILLLILIGVLGYNYVYQDHRDIQSEASVFSVSSKKILEEFQVNSEDSESKYLDKTITVSGTATQIESHAIVLDNSVFCQFPDKIDTKLQNAKNISIKGRFLGYDDLLKEVKLDQCHIIN